MANYFKWEQPTENGDVIYELLTRKGVETLLEPIKIGDASAIASELLTLRNAVSELSQTVSELSQTVEELKKKIPETTENPATPQVPSVEELKQRYPNISSLRVLSDPEIVELGLSLGIPGVDIDLRASENDDIVIKWFETEVWTK